MSGLLTHRVRGAIELARRLTAERAEREEAIESAWSAASGEAQRSLDRAVERLERQAASERAGAARVRDDAVTSAQNDFERRHGEAKRKYTAQRTIVQDASAAKREVYEQRAQESSWLAREVAESDELRTNEQRAATADRIADRRRRVNDLIQSAEEAMAEAGLYRPPPAQQVALEQACVGAVSSADDEFERERAEAVTEKPKDIAAAISEELEQRDSRDQDRRPPELEVKLRAAADALQPIVRNALVTWSHGWLLAAIAAVTAGLGVVGGLAADGWSFGPYAIVLGIAGVVAGVAFGWMMRTLARRSLKRAWPIFADAVHQAWRRIAIEERLADLRAKERLEQVRRQRDNEVAAANDEYERNTESINTLERDKLKELDDHYLPYLEKAERIHSEQIAQARAAHDARIEQMERIVSEQRAAAQAAFDESTSGARESRDRDRAALIAWWGDTSRQLREAFADIGRFASIWPDWEEGSLRAPALSPEGSPTNAARIARLSIDLRELPGGLSDAPDLAWRGEAAHTLPVALEVPEAASLLATFGARGRDEATALLRTAMLRLLTVLPAGKARFTIIDPVGLGQGFAGFMHLADFNEALVAHRIWTEPRHIEQRLAELTEHMENVIQKYLRNEFATIADYNEHAGEIAEPYRFLVISDFPSNFEEQTAKRLSSIISSGPRCGVHTLIALDTRAKLPAGIDLADIRQASTEIDCSGEHPVLKDEAAEGLPFALDREPDEATLTSIVKRIGEASVDASRVEVPFAVVAPQSDDELWSRNSAENIRVPLGRSGATKLQELDLGRGTAQHVLIAGKTGSGKSTLLHVLVTNLALWYAPDQVEFYLVDFKKGVEFKTYATHTLPHTRAVAIESDREFGLSVLERVDAELRRRGDLFRDAGVQNVAGFREARPGTPMPRTLLIIDEFQELFIEDDKLAQDASLLLDRLVRQGRAFGIHVILGSQTLGGAYTLARSTLNQMAIRIALQCSEADSYLILNEDNAAARLLSRPGEAIYNDAAGMIEGNSPFQIVWLPDATRDSALGRAEQRALSSPSHAAPTIVFEGNVPARLSEHPRVAALLSGEGSIGAALDPLATGVSASGPLEIWLGQPIAIKPPSAVLLRRQSGSNVLFVGQRDDAAAGLTTAALLGIAAQRTPGDIQVFMLGAAADVAEQTNGSDPLSTIASRLPHDVRPINAREIAQTLGAIAQEVQTRLDADDAERAEAPEIALVIHGLHRYRDLRRSEDDFGFGMSGDEPQTPKADKLLATILRDGPAVGVHVVAWCDTLTNAERCFDRQLLREFEHRVAMQMSVGDSTAFVDSPAASKLGPQRLLYANEDAGILEKFRPYAVPEGADLAQLLDSIRAAAVR